MNAIFVHELRVDTRIGVYAWEQHLPQTLLIDMEIALPSTKAFTSDDFDDALDYAPVVKRVQAFAADHPHKLLERFAEALAEVLRTEFGSPWVRLSVAEPSDTRERCQTARRSHRARRANLKER